MALFAVTLALLVLVVFWMVGLRTDVAEMEARQDLSDKLEVLKLPVSFLMQEPECANKLLQEMGIDNVRISERGLSNHSGLDHRSPTIQ